MNFETLFAKLYPVKVKWFKPVICSLNSFEMSFISINPMILFGKERGMRVLDTKLQCK